MTMVSMLAPFAAIFRGPFGTYKADHQGQELQVRPGDVAKLTEHGFKLLEATKMTKFTNDDVMKLAMSTFYKKADTGELAINAKWTDFIPEAVKQFESVAVSSDQLAKHAPPYSGQRATPDQVKQIADIQERRLAVRTI
jgi:hypothetical protein